MNGIDIVLLLLIAAALALAVRHIIRRRRQGKGCCGDCASCSGCACRRTPQ